VVSGYAYWDTLQVARTAQRLLSQPPESSVPPARETKA
jgi:hypothetical protein